MRHSDKPVIVHRNRHDSLIATMSDYQYKSKRNCHCQCRHLSDSQGSDRFKKKKKKTRLLIFVKSDANETFKEKKEVQNPVSRLEFKCK